MKSLNEYFQMVVFTSLLNKVHVFANFMFKLKEHGSEGLSKIIEHLCAQQLHAENPYRFEQHIRSKVWQTICVILPFPLLFGDSLHLTFLSFFLQTNIVVCL